MINGKSVIAVIPARGGSKGLPGKNIKILCGKPLIAWTIEAALSSQFIDEVMVSTDSEEIASISKKFGAKIPFIRPANLARDLTSSYDVIEHALFFYEEELKRKFDYIIMLEPTSPLRDQHDIDAAFKQLMADESAEAIVGVSKTESQNPAFLVFLDEKDHLIGYENKDMPVQRRQDIRDVYFFEGSVYISVVQTLLRKKTFYHEGTLGFVVPKWKSPEIDDSDDFVIVEALMKHKGIHE